MTSDLAGTLPFSPYQISARAVGPVDSQSGNKAVSDAVPRFEEALRGATAAENVEGVQVAQLADPNVDNVTAPGVVTDATAVEGTPPVEATVESAQADARTRAAEGLGLAEPSGTETSGTSILSGLEQLRSVFDQQYSGVGQNLEGTRMDVTDMMALQAEVIKYSVLVDVSSKLAGKSTQAMDSLMKGQ